MGMNDFEKLISILESPGPFHREIKKLIAFMDGNTNYPPMFDNFIARRLRENIHPERLLNLVNHLESYEKTRHLSESVNRQIAGYVCFRSLYLDHFYYMCRHDERTGRHILNTVVWQLAHIKSKDAIKVVDTIYPHILIDKYDLLYKILEADADGGFIRQSIFMNSLSVEDRYFTVIKVLKNDSPIFSGVQEVFMDMDFSTYCLERFQKSGDSDDLTKAIRSTKLTIKEFSRCYYFNDFILINAETIPQTIEHLYQLAEQGEEWRYLLALGSTKNKRDVLRSLLKSKDPEIIDLFFHLYRGYSEVRHLAPFL